MRRREQPRNGFPPSLAVFSADGWVDRYHWAMARWEYWKAHRAELRDVDPIELLRERREARLEAA